MQCTVYSIGHSNHSFEYFLDLLKAHNITAIADVRSSPASRYNPHFNKQSLIAALKDAGIQYVFLGDSLGARVDDPSCYENNRVQYCRIAKRPEFIAGIERLVAGASRYRIAMMCAEREPLDCHRTLLVAEELRKRSIQIQHIHSDGHLENQERALERLIEVVGLPSNDLFLAGSDLVSEALRKQEEKIAYTTDKAN